MTTSSPCMEDYSSEDYLDALETVVEDGDATVEESDANYAAEADTALEIVVEVGDAMTEEYSNAALDVVVEESDSEALEADNCLDDNKDYPAQGDAASEDYNSAEGDGISFEEWSSEDDEGVYFEVELDDVVEENSSRSEEDTFEDYSSGGDVSVEDYYVELENSAEGDQDEPSFVLYVDIITI